MVNTEPPRQFIRIFIFIWRIGSGDFYTFPAPAAAAGAADKLLHLYKSDGGRPAQPSPAQPSPADVDSITVLMIRNTRSAEAGRGGHII